MKNFKVEQYGGELHFIADGWPMKGDVDKCRREFNKWLDECNQD